MKKILLVAVMMVSVTSVFAQFFNPFFNPMACGVVYPRPIVCLPPPPPAPVINFSSIDEIHERALKAACEHVDKVERDFRASYKKSHPNATEAEINSALGNHFENLNKAGQNAQMCTTSSSSYNSSSSNSSTSSMSNASSSSIKCSACNGTGKVYRDLSNYSMKLNDLRYCSVCGKTASPHTHDSPCTICYGRGYIK